MNIELKKVLVYVTRDIERALGMEPVTYGAGGYFIISNDTAYGRKVRKKYPGNVILVKSSLDTYDLLTLPEVAEFITRNNADILVFQNTQRIERFCAEKGWRLLNPSAELAKRVEEKISQVAWLGDDASLLPPHKIMVLKKVQFEGKKFVLQFNHSHTGQGTYVINHSDELAPLQQKFPDRECRVVDFIDGPVFTVNAVVGKDSEIIIGNPSYQITGLASFTDLPFSTIGNDWDLPQAIQYQKTCTDIKTIAQKIAVRLAGDGWRGLFGIDVVFDEKLNKTYLLEINARQPASTVFESILQKTETIFSAHVASLLNEQITNCTHLISGAQIVKRVTVQTYSVDTSALLAKNLTVIKYENTEHNKELFRIQSTAGIMKAHNIFNELGKFIASCLN